MKITSILKEIFIVILLALAIVLILGVLFYNYIPTNKILPNQVAYVQNKEINELKQRAEEEEALNQTTVTYQIDETQLKVYQSSGSYVPGKKNPFATVDEINNNTANPDPSTNVTNSENNTQKPNNQNTNTNVSNPDSTGTFYNRTGGK